MKISLYPRALVIFSALMFLVTAEAASAQPEQPEPDTVLPLLIHVDSGGRVLHCSEGLVGETR